MKRFLILLYGAAAYAAFFITILYAIGFVANVVVPKSIDSGTPGPLPVAFAVNGALLGAFAIQHTIMARKSFKAWVTRFIPAAVERSTFVIVASGLLMLTYWQWRPMPEVVWSVPCRTGSLFFSSVSWMGWGLVFLSTFLINHFDLFGLRQVWLAFREKTCSPLVFRTNLLYKLVRHPLMLGFLLAFWSAPVMTQGRLLFAVLTTAYILVGIQFEERDLIEKHGKQYRKYREEVPMLIPYRVPKLNKATGEAGQALAVTK